MDQKLNSLSTITSQNFSGLSARCLLYYDAMMFVFRENNICLESVSVGLAARCASYYMRINTRLDNDQHQDFEKCDLFRAALRERLNGSPMQELEDWAYEILATYLIA
jgi:hypothetical protein